MAEISDEMFEALKRELKDTPMHKGLLAHLETIFRDVLGGVAAMLSWAHIESGSPRMIWHEDTLIGFGSSLSSRKRDLGWMEIRVNETYQFPRMVFFSFDVVGKGFIGFTEITDEVSADDVEAMKAILEPWTENDWSQEMASRILYSIAGERLGPKEWLPGRPKNG